MYADPRFQGVRLGIEFRPNGESTFLGVERQASSYDEFAEMLSSYIAGAQERKLSDVTVLIHDNGLIYFAAMNARQE